MNTKRTMLQRLLLLAMWMLLLIGLPSCDHRIVIDGDSTVRKYKTGDVVEVPATYQPPLIYGISPKLMDTCLKYWADDVANQR